jgi:hypothetical protein
VADIAFVTGRFNVVSKIYINFQCH